uniref:Leucine rich repeats and immunoglobulin like domains 2 n=1 Tax=Oncorhynchus kisutch TaxID=8019 RepID=A0A8C7J296_ONCKI
PASSPTGFQAHQWLRPCPVMVHNRISELWMHQLHPYISLETLDLSSNSNSEIKAGAFPTMQLKYFVLEPACFDNLSSSLLVLKLNRNRITLLPYKVFRLPQLQFLELKRNKIKLVDSLTFKGMDLLKSLKMQRNGITKLMDGAFFGFNNMEVLELEHNNLTEVNKGWLYGLHMLHVLRVNQNTIGIIRPDAWEFCQKLEELDLSFNHLTRLEETVFIGLGLLENLNLGENTISHLGEGVFSSLANLRSLFLNTSSLLCDCQLQWLGPWLTDNRFLHLLGRNVLSVSLEELVCDDFPKPRITDHPETATALRGTNVTELPGIQQKDWEVLYDAEVQNCTRYQEGKLFYTTVLYLLNVNFTDEGCYQCVVSNHFGSNYSNRAKLPSFLKTPMHLTIPRTSLLPDDIFFTANVKTEDMGVYSCTAQNAAGSMSANATLTVLGELHSYLPCIAGGSPAPRLNWTKDDGPLVLTERHFFAATNQLLIIVDTGKYTCIMSNTLGTERGHIYLSVSPNCDTAGGYDWDSWNTVGIVVVCCVVGTLLVWVIVIYHMRRKSEDYSITNSDEMKLPVDIPSYLSSQGTLSEPQEGYSNSEAGSHQQLMPPLSNGYVHKGTGGAGPLVICSDCDDNINMYSRTREYYAYLAEDDPLDKGLSGIMAQLPKEPYGEQRGQHEDTALESLINNQDSSVFLTSHNSSVFLTKRSFWGKREDLSTVPRPGLSQQPVTVHTTPYAGRGGVWRWSSLFLRAHSTTEVPLIGLCLRSTSKPPHKALPNHSAKNAFLYI